MSAHCFVPAASTKESSVPTPLVSLVTLMSPNTDGDITMRAQHRSMHVILDEIEAIRQTAGFVHEHCSPKKQSVKIVVEVVSLLDD